MARKKRRKLKRSVKVGCLMAVLFPVVLYLAVGLLVQRCSVEPREHTEAPADVEPAKEADFTELHDRLDRLMNAPMWIDTSQISLSVCDIASSTVIYSRHADRLLPPASCMKLLTAMAAMEYLGVEHHYVEQVKLCGEVSDGTLCGTVLFQLDDDPMVETLSPMVEALKTHGIRHIEGDLVFDLLREDTLKAHSTAATWDIPYRKLPILLKGRERIERDLAYLLQSSGITLHRNPLFGAPALQGIDPVNTPLLYRQELNRLAGSGRSVYLHRTPLTEVLAPMLIHSSNIKADALTFHLAHVCDRLVPSQSSAPERLVDFLRDCIHLSPDELAATVVNDGSGLSPDNRLTVDILLRILRYGWEHEGMRRVLLDEALATPGHPTRHGSLLGRMSAPMYRNKIFVKTGTLTTIGLSSLAGYARTADGQWLLFAIVNEDSPVMDSRIFQDKVCHELVR